MSHRDMNVERSEYKPEGLPLEPTFSLIEVLFAVKLHASNVILTPRARTQEDDVRYNAPETNLSACLCGIHPRGDAGAIERQTRADGVQLITRRPIFPLLCN
jgi:hypothetical protein